MLTKFQYILKVMHAHTLRHAQPENRMPPAANTRWRQQTVGYSALKQNYLPAR